MEKVWLECRYRTSGIYFKGNPWENNELISKVMTVKCCGWVYLPFILIIVQPRLNVETQTTHKLCEVLSAISYHIIRFEIKAEKGNIVYGGSYYLTCFIFLLSTMFISVTLTEKYDSILRWYFDNFKQIGKDFSPENLELFYWKCVCIVLFDFAVYWIYWEQV